MVGIPLLFAILSFNLGHKTVPLSSMDIGKMTAGWGRAQAGKSIEGNPLTVDGKVYQTGVGTHAISRLKVALDGKVNQFSTLLGVDDETIGKGKGAVRLILYADGNRIFASQVVESGQAPIPVTVSLVHARSLLILIRNANDGIDYDHADLLNARFDYSGTIPKAVAEPAEPPYILTPPPPKSPRLNTAPVIGGYPGRPFLYRIPATGVRPMRFEAFHLPMGLGLNSRTGIISGTSPSRKGEYTIRIRAINRKGSDAQTLVIHVGNTLALTPPMGWNSWYIHYMHVTDANMRKAADMMISSGMADVGYQYVNIDDGWARTQNERPLRDSHGAILPSSKFPDMRALTKYIHAKGLKAGIYTSPGPQTCGGCTGAYEHEMQDAQTFADWGFDFLKYDWCSYGSVAKGQGLDRLEMPYVKMGQILKGLDREMVFNLCQYGMGDVWNWGASVGGNCWRTTGDLGLAATWRDIARANMKHWNSAGPGHWNDPDYILIGWVGNASQMGPGRKTSLVPSEQYSYMSMWCLMASPLIFSGDMAKLDAFTLNVLCNPEVIAVDQDALGRQARVIRDKDSVILLAKPMADGSTAVGLFNFDEVARKIGFTWKEVGLGSSHRPKRVRDLWRQRDLSIGANGFNARIPVGGCVMVRIWPYKPRRN